MIPSSSPPRFVVLTGGPGAGKSTLLDALAAAGFATVAEAGRAIIRDQAAIGGSALHTVDPQLYADLMLSWEMRSYREAAGRPARSSSTAGSPTSWATTCCSDGTYRRT